MIPALIQSISQTCSTYYFKETVGTLAITLLAGDQGSSRIGVAITLAAAVSEVALVVFVGGTQAFPFITGLVVCRTLSTLAVLGFVKTLTPLSDKKSTKSFLIFNSIIVIATRILFLSPSQVLFPVNLPLRV